MPFKIFFLINVEDINHELPDYQSLHLTDKWIISKMHTSIQKIDKQYDQYKLNEVIKTIYEFVYDYFCDWYIEFTKTRFYLEKTRFISSSCFFMDSWWKLKEIEHSKAFEEEKEEKVDPS